MLLNMKKEVTTLLEFLIKKKPASQPVFFSLNTLSYMSGKEINYYANGPYRSREDRLSNRVI